MPRRSQQIDRALLASARALFPATGCARLSVRAVAEHAGVQPAMLH
jgi:AcrR family transcriptional regulator